MNKIIGVKIIKDGTITEKPYDITIDSGIIKEITESKHDSGLFATAGYIDIHTHGGYGHDYFECTQEASDATGKFHLDNGTTSFVATCVATKLDVLDEQIAKIRKLDNNYATLIGLHMEGPFISVKKKGAQPEENIKDFYEDSDGLFFEKNKDLIKIVTMCPHTKNAPNLVKKLVSVGITAHAGHDDSIYPEIMDCVKMGLNGATHLYCASSAFGRRKDDLTKYLGLNETALLEQSLMCEVIADDMHISQPLFKFIYSNKGYRNIMLISDSLSAGGMPIGNYKLGQTVDIYNNGKVALLADRSALAGSISCLSQEVQNLISYGIPLEQAVYMANQAPSQHLNLTDRGVIEIGKVADINIIDHKGKLQKTYHNKI